MRLKKKKKEQMGYKKLGFQSSERKKEKKRK